MKRTIKILAGIYFGSIPVVLTLCLIIRGGMFDTDAQIVQNWIWFYEGAATIAAAVFLWSQLKEAKEQTANDRKNIIHQNTINLILFLERDEFRAARKYMYDCRDGTPNSEKLSQEDELEMEKVCISLDFACLQLFQSMVDVELILEQWKAPIAKSWAYLKP